VVVRFKILALLLGMISSGSAWALPAYSRLYQGKYGYRASCNLCHSAGGGSSVTNYGRDFLRAGANLQAFAKIEGKDSDGDGIMNLAEILAKSNAGDSRSVPGKDGDWLADAAQIPVPEKDLKKLFPTADAFSAQEGSLNSAQTTAVESRIGSSLSDEDKVPTFYFSLTGGKRTSVAQFVAAPSPKGPISIAVALDIKATVLAVHVLKNPAQKLIEEKSFLSQFIGKTQADPISIGSDIKPANGDPELSKEVALAVRKAVLVINTVFGSK
jgi:electron transport complex protein RnfG